MSTLQEVLSALRRERKRLFAKHALTSMAVFGSTARGEQRPGSDVDIMVEFDTTKDYDFLELAEELEQLLKRKVDLSYAHERKAVVHGAYPTRSASCLIRRTAPTSWTCASLPDGSYHVTRLSKGQRPVAYQPMATPWVANAAPERRAEGPTHRPLHAFAGRPLRTL